MSLSYATPGYSQNKLRSPQPTNARIKQLTVTAGHHGQMMVVTGRCWLLLAGAGCHEQVVGCYWQMLVFVGRLVLVVTGRCWL